MSNPESFIDEVTEEVRRDRTMALMRRWGPIALAVVVLGIGAAAWSEWSKARAEASAEAFGDAVIAAVSIPEPADRRAAIAALDPGDAPQEAVLGLLEATALLGGEGADPQAARARLLAVAELDGVDPLYRDLALLKAILLGGTGDAARDGLILESLATPGAPYRALAIEQQAVTAIEAGDTATAVTLLRALTEAADAPTALRERARQTIVALGAAPEPA